MIIWDDSIPKPAISLTFAAQTPSTEQPQRACPKADLWHQRLGYASHDSILHMHTVTLSHNIHSLRATHPSVLCDMCIHSKATARTVAHPRHVSVPLELVSMDVMGPMHGATKFAYVLIIHDAYSSMIWARGLMNKGQASQEAVWWFSEVCVTRHYTSQTFGGDPRPWTQGNPGGPRRVMVHCLL
ncbi:uncharacterized protein UBRO_20339 [Ustilago bromivora]|uniref:GAG-pre-integrase domain-containing protein n=1 Tax=Ustilago bromivora TaxID=307758 RepID=A0A1K0GE02_9BASI|nr:uncharacterized protein UBRO_20339 [Ustilago bromivora]